MGSVGCGSGWYWIRNESAIRRKARNPLRIMMSQLGLRGRSSVDAAIAAVSSTHPAAVIQLRSGCGDRKNTSARLAGVALLDVDEPRLPPLEEIVVESVEPADPRVSGQQLDRARRKPGAHLEHPDQRFAPAERAVDRGQVGDHQRDQAEPDARLDELQDDSRRTPRTDEPQREQRRPAGGERFCRRDAHRCPRRST